MIRRIPLRFRVLAAVPLGYVLLSISPALLFAAAVLVAGAVAVRYGALQRYLAWMGYGEDAPSISSDEDRAQIEAGGLPLSARKRLGELADSGGLFTSDLSVNEFALLEREGIRPLTQVMGSSIFKHGWQNLPYGPGSNWGGSSYGYGARTTELTSISGAFNGARERALARLREEAALVGADAVVGVRIDDGEHEWAGDGTVEFTAFGTAVRLPEALRTGEPVITDLSAQQYWQLARAGYRPVGVVGISTVMYVGSGWRQNQVAAYGNRWFNLQGRKNQELPDFTRGFYEARETALGHLNRQASKLGAHGIVGVTFDEHIREREFEDASDQRRKDLIVYIHLLGTAITEGHAPLADHAVLTVMPLRSTATKEARRHGQAV